MKSRFLKTVSLLIILTFLLSLFPAGAYAKPDKEMRGLWVASVLNIDYPSKPTTVLKF